MLGISLALIGRITVFPSWHLSVITLACREPRQSQISNHYPHKCMSDRSLPVPLIQEHDVYYYLYYLFLLNIV